MSELSPAARALIDAAKGADAPGVDDELRVQDSLYAKLGISAGAIASTGAATAGGTAGPSTLLNASSAGGVASGGGFVAAKVGLAVIATIGLAIGGYYTLRSDDGGKDGQTSRAPATPKEATQPPSNLGAVPPATSKRFAVKPAEPAVANTKPAPPKRRTHRRTKQPRVIKKKPMTSPLNALLEEKRLIAKAQGASRDGDAAQALRLLDAHAKKFPNGILVPERYGTRILALCKLGRKTEAQLTTSGFLRSWPRHPMAQRVRRSCGHKD